jgi:hypothetical protein
MTHNDPAPAEGVIAEFDNPAVLLEAARHLRESGYQRFDCHSPFPIHGMDEAMGLSRSPLGWMVGGMAFAGAGIAVLLQWWTGAIDYPLVISGKPLFSYQAYAPVTFGLAVLLGAITAFIGLLALSRLPQPFHPVFFSDYFSKSTDDGFFVSIDAEDPLFDETQTPRWLQEIGGKNVEVLREQ